MHILWNCGAIKKIIVNGSIQTDDGSYRKLEDFDLDRDAISIEELTDKLLTQDEKIETLCDSLETAEQSHLPFTSFEYIANDCSGSHIAEMLEYIESILPYIFCFNDKLKEVTLLHRVPKQEYIRTDSANGMIHISKNGQSIKIPFVYNQAMNVKVIIGAEDRILTDIPKQFLFYPLMETMDVGYNFLVHANDFKPNKERDYLHKLYGNEELKADIETNEILLKTAFDLVLQTVEGDETLSFMEITKIEFTQGDSDFEKKLKTNYINTIKDLERLEFGGGKFSVISLQYFDKSILLLDEEVRKSIYSLLIQFRSLPPFEKYIQLSSYVNNWNEYTDEKFGILTLKDIGEIIANEGGGNYLNITDKASFKKFITQVSADISLLNKLALVPNIHGDFKLYESLVRWESKEAELVKIVDNINASTSEKYIHEEFYFLENVNSYNREKYKEDLSKLCNDLIDNISKEKQAFSKVRFSMLTEYLIRFVALNRKTQLNIDLVKFYERVFKLAPNDVNLSDPTVDVNYQPAIKLLANLYIKGLSTSEIKHQLFDLKEVLSIMFKNTNLKEELLHRLVCLPNQEYILKSQNELKSDEVNDDDFKNDYDKITGNKVRADLAYPGFEVFLQHTGSVSGSFLGEKIETTLNSDKKFIPVVPGIIDVVLKLIEKISERPNTWGQWLPNINRVKEEILMHKFQNANTRSSLFSILTKDEKTIELLGNLAKIENLEELIKDGQERQREEERKNNHLNYIGYIGLTIQELIQQELELGLVEVVSVLKSEEDKELTTQEEQNGQDFIIYKNQVPIYYIEVKSKWDENGRFALSKNQTERCASQKNKYAVVSVNVDRYKKKHSINIDNIPFEDLKEFVKVNDDLGKDFEKLIIENLSKAELNDPKLIEYRGSIPQKVIDFEGMPFDFFVNKLIQLIKIA